VESSYIADSFLTSALDGGEWSASRLGHALPPGKGPPVPIVQEAGWVSEPVWTQRWEEKYFSSAGGRTPLAHYVVRRYARHNFTFALLDQDTFRSLLAT
jgi:hypothetical protein